MTGQHAFKVGDRVEFDPTLDTLRREYWDYGSKEADVLAVLDNVILVKLAKDHPKLSSEPFLVYANELVRFTEDFEIGQEVTFMKDGRTTPGTIITDVLMLDGVAHYGVAIYDGHDVVPAQSLSDDS